MQLSITDILKILGCLPPPEAKQIHVYTRVYVLWHRGCLCMIPTECIVHFLHQSSQLIAAPE